MNNTKKIGLIISSLLLICNLSASAATPAEQDQIANNCKPYLQQYGAKGSIPASVAKAAAPALSQCVVNSSCANANLSGIPNCALKLSNLSLDASLADVSTTPTPTNSNIKAPTPQPHRYQAPSIQPYIAPTRTTPTNETTTTTDSNTQKQQKKQPTINWF